MSEKLLAQCEMGSFCLNLGFLVFLWARFIFFFRF